MSFWMILGWVFVLILTAINIVVFLKLKGASEQMLKMAFPGAKDMNDALARMQQMMGRMGGAGGMGGFPGGGFPGGGGGGGSKDREAQLRSAMKLLQNSNPKGGRKR